MLVPGTLVKLIEGHFMSRHHGHLWVLKEVRTRFYHGASPYSDDISNDDTLLDTRTWYSCKSLATGKRYSFIRSSFVLETQGELS